MGRAEGYDEFGEFVCEIVSVSEADEEIDFMDFLDRSLGVFLLKTAVDEHRVVVHPCHVPEPLDAIRVRPLVLLGVVYVQW